MTATETALAEIQAIAERHGLTLELLRAVLIDTDKVRGLLGPADVEAGLQRVLQIYLGALSATAERITDPAERLLVDRFMSRAMEALAGQLEAAPHRPN